MQSEKKLHNKLGDAYLSPFVGNIITARALFAAALSKDFVELRLQLSHCKIQRKLPKILPTNTFFNRTSLLTTTKKEKDTSSTLARAWLN